MSLTINNIGDQPIVPGSVGYLYTSDQLIAGDQKLVTGGQATITGGALLPRGTVLGKITLGAVTQGAYAGTGNGTSSALSAGPNALTGNYLVASLTPTTFSVTDPNGNALPVLNTGVAYKSAGVNLTITVGSTAFVAGDLFTINVAAGSQMYKASVSTANDGSQAPSAILAETTDASSGNVNGGIYLSGEFNENRITYDTSFTLAALYPLLRVWNIHLKSAVIADPAS